MALMCEKKYEVGIDNLRPDHTEILVQAFRPFDKLRVNIEEASG